jgi:hypothetical protein
METKVTSGFSEAPLHVGLMAVAVEKNVGAALLNEVDCGIVAGFIFANVVLPDDAGVRNTNVSGSGLDAFDVRGVIARVIVVNEDYADFEGGFFGVASVAGSSAASTVSGVAVTSAAGSVVVWQAARENTIMTTANRAMIFFMVFLLLNF